MSEKNRPLFYIVVNLIIINVVILGVMNLRYPQVGHDYTLTIPSILDTVLHFRLNGLSIQWFTPTFGGGIPAFPNPNNGQFSLVILLAMVLPPWEAIMASTVIYLSAGFIASYYFFRRTLSLYWTASILGAVFFTANGFFISRVAPGQFGYITFSLLVIFLIILLDKSIPIGMAGTLLGLITAMYIHIAGYFIIIISGLSILILLPLVFIYQPDLIQWKRIFAIATIGGVIGIAISVSKLAAVYSFTRYFPRFMADNYVTSPASGILGIILELMGTMSLVPIYLIAGLNPDLFPSLTRAMTDTHYGLWELDMAVTPVVFVILLIGLVNFLHNRKKHLGKLNKNKTALLFFIIFLWIGIEFTLAKGFIYPLLKNLPILSSLRANVRFASIFIFPLAFSAAIIYSNWEKTLDAPKILRNFFVVNALALLPLSAYFLFNSDMYWAFYDVRPAEKIYSEIRNGDSFEVVGIGRPEGKNTGALLSRLSNLNLYEPIFGFQLENFHPQVTEGSIWNISNGYYNMTDPTGFVYPELNQNKPFERFRVKDKQTLEIFAKHLQPQWKIPTYQHVLDWVSGLTFLGALLYILAHGIKKIKSRSKSHELV